VLPPSSGMIEPSAKVSRLYMSPVDWVGQSEMRDDRLGLGPMAVGWAVQSRRKIEGGVKESTSETSVDNYFTRQYVPEDNSELHTRRRENLKSQEVSHRSFQSPACNLEAKLDH
jgi:hypothetical protein